VSGPSKTADIELILAFGVHGPKELVVLILE
jgi:L-lactate dehydrogenase complex protein LldG